MGDERRTRVYITVDVEGAEERVHGSAVTPPLGYDLRAWGRLSNQRDELGLPFITHTLAQHRLAATFFVEALGSSHFGLGGLRDVCQFLRDAGQDVQLHLHPIQRRVQWHSLGQRPLHDDMATYAVDQQADLLQRGLELLERCGVDRASLRAFRAGNFGANEDTWRAMALVGLRVSSNYNLCYLAKNCRLQWPQPANSLFDTGCGVWELPISNFSDGESRFRHLQVSAVSFAEMAHFLLEAARLGLPEVTVVTHPFEYFFLDDPVAGTGRRNHLNVERLQRLAAFLGDRRDLFEVETVGALAARIARQGEAAAATTNVVPRGRPALRMGRMAEQAWKRVSAVLPLF